MTPGKLSYFFLFFFLLIPVQILAYDQIPASTEGTEALAGNSGAYVFNFPLEVPDGPGHFTPKVELVYNSLGHNGWLGNGWDIPISYIMRSTKHGVNYNCNSSTDTCFVFVNGEGASELVLRSDLCPTCYGAKIERNFTLFVLSSGTNGTYWQAVDKTGSRYFFGQTSASRLDNPADPTQVFKWNLNTASDINNNQIAYTYFKDIGLNNSFVELYPSTITYGPNKISFGLAFYARGDVWTLCKQSINGSKFTNNWVTLFH